MTYPCQCFARAVYLKSKDKDTNVDKTKVLHMQFHVYLRNLMERIVTYGLNDPYMRSFGFAFVAPPATTTRLLLSIRDC